MTTSDKLKERIEETRYCFTTNDFGINIVMSNQLAIMSALVELLEKKEEFKVNIQNNAVVNEDNYYQRQMGLPIKCTCKNIGEAENCNKKCGIGANER